MDSLRLSAEHDTHKKFRNGSTLYWTARAILNGFRPICDDVEGAKRECEAKESNGQLSQQANGGGSAASSSASAIQLQHEPVWLKVMHKAAELYQVTNGANTVSKRELEWHEMEHKNGGLYQLANGGESGAYPAAKQNGGCDHVSQPANFGEFDFTSAEWEMVQQNCGCDAFATAELERQFYESLQRLDGCDDVSNFGEFGFASAEGSAKKKKSDLSSEVFGLVTFAVLLGASIGIAKFHVRYMA